MNCPTPGAGSPRRTTRTRCWPSAPMRTTHLHIRTPGQLAAFAGLPHIRRVYLTSDNGIPREITERRDLEWLVVEHNPGVADLSVLSGHRALRHLGVFDCPGVTSIEPVAELTADSLAFGYVQNGLSLAPLAGDTRAAVAGHRLRAEGAAHRGRPGSGGADQADPVAGCAGTLPRRAGALARADLPRHRRGLAVRAVRGAAATHRTDLAADPVHRAGGGGPPAPVPAAHRADAAALRAHAAVWSSCGNCRD